MDYPYAYRPDNNFDYCCATGDDCNGNVGINSGPRDQRAACCESNDYTPCDDAPCADYGTLLSDEPTSQPTETPTVINATGVPTEIPSATGCNGGDSCCTSSNQCSIGEGDCDLESDCLGDLVCGTNNCEGDTFGTADDCCREAKYIDPNATLQVFLYAGLYIYIVQKVHIYLYV